MNMKTNLRIEHLQDDRFYKNSVGKVLSGREIKENALECPKLYNLAFFDEIEQKSELDAFTEVKLRKEWKTLLDHVANDPEVKDWVLELAVERCREIQKMLHSMK